ncbi:MAG: 30S ribosomal protein S18 [Thermodesulfobacteriota bacterium]|nr:MAG: 30S ribosomal protein S18 [Thermodesulfobacteriota bacterium]
MADNRRPYSPQRSRPGAPRRSFVRKRYCRFCKHKDLKIDYKDGVALRPYVTERGKIMPRRITGTCAKHQRKVCTAIERARNIALLPFTTMNMQQ